MKATHNKYVGYVLQLKYSKELMPKDCEIGFMKVRDISKGDFFDEDSDTGNAFIDEIGWKNFKQSILEHGTYWVFHISNFDYSPSHNRYKEGSCWYINEGFHRFKALLELIDEGKLSKDHKILVIRKNVHPLWYSNNNYFKALEEKVNSCYGYIDTDVIKPAREINEPGYYWKSL
mgnify:CR=1 FL=1